MAQAYEALSSKGKRTSFRSTATPDEHVRHAELMLDPILSEAIDFLERGDVITIFFDDLMGEARFGEKPLKWAVKSIAKRGIRALRGVLKNALVMTHVPETDLYTVSTREGDEMSLQDLKMWRTRLRLKAAFENLASKERQAKAEL